MLSGLRARSKPSRELESRDQPATAHREQDLAAALETIIGNHPDASRIGEGPAREAFTRVAKLLREQREAQLASAVGLVAETAATATHVGWITHDIREVAGNTTKIAGSIDELARTVTEISNSGSKLAEQMMTMGHDVHHGIEKMQRAGEVMGLIHDS